MPWNPDHYKNVNWNTSSTRKSEPPVNKKLLLKLHNEWAKANGYKPQASSSKHNEALEGLQRYVKNTKKPI